MALEEEGCPEEGLCLEEGRQQLRGIFHSFDPSKIHLN